MTRRLSPHLMNVALPAAALLLGLSALGAQYELTSTGATAVKALRRVADQNGNG